ncbi:MAG: protein kinase [Lachnospiraceae bacterium]|nr:protein kinase [Lachnospiraceae bacterium]
MSKKKKPEKNIPAYLGNMVCGVRPQVTGLLINALIHIGIFVVYGAPLQQLWRFILSFFFFIYPCSYVTDILWSLRPSVRSVLIGETLINRKNYMNAPRREVKASDLLPVTVSIPVYTEENSVIFETVRKSLCAVRSYREYSHCEANVLVSEDGLAPLLGGVVTRDIAENVLMRFLKDPDSLSEKERKAAERIRFYRENNVGFIARPQKGRKGLFKKASNLNYSLRFGDYQEREYRSNDPDDLLSLGYAEGDYRTHEIILLLDKDSGVKEGVIEAILPEFGLDERLAYVQCATDTINLKENYYSRATGHLTNDLFHYIWPGKALQGFFVPLVGHNVFLRKSILEKCGRWAEDKVSEDYDLAIRLYGMGYHGKYAKIPGLEFTEYTSTNFEEETGKQRRYAYGLMEMVFDGTMKGNVRPCDRFFMFLYFFSIVNQIMLLPTVFIECYFGNIHLLWAGFLVCDACFILSPWLRSIIMGRKLPKEHRTRIVYTLELAISFISHSLSVFLGAMGWVINKLKRRKKGFPSTRVGENDRGLLAGLSLIFGYIKGTWLFLPVAALCVDRSMYVITRRGIGTESRIAYCFIFFSMVLTPVLFTPPLYAWGSGERKAKRIQAMLKNPSKGWTMTGPVPEVVETAAEKSLEDDVAAFLQSYGAGLEDEVRRSAIPEEITSRYTVTGCLKKDEQGKKETYFLKRIADDAPAILRITRDYKPEDALEEARILESLDHPGIPKVYASFEKDGGHYMIREFIEGKTLDEIVRAKGTLSESDIYAVTSELTGILKYLHHQTPPVIHRDIKPQNIVLAKDGSINLIDFGIARVHKSGQRQDTSIVLTLDYAPPEQYGFDQSSPVTDIYSLGVVMLFLATGQASKPDLESEIISPKLRNLIRRCIAFDPRDRIQKVEEIEAVIDQNKRNRIKYIRRTAVLAAAAFLTVVGSYFGGRLIGQAEGKKAGTRQGYDGGYVSGYQSVPIYSLGERTAHPENGNVPENMLVNGGAYALSYENYIYFINDGDIFRMTSDGGTPELFVEGMNASGISAFNGWLYYTSGRDIYQRSVYTEDENVTYGDIDGYMAVLDGRYFITAGEDVYELNLEDWSLTPAGADYVKDYASQNYTEKVMQYVEDCSPVQFAVESRGIVLLDGFDEMIWLCNPKGTIRTRITRNRAADFNIAGEWIFYHNKDDNGRLWSVRYDGADDHRVQYGE